MIEGGEYAHTAGRTALDSDLLGRADTMMA
jgi:hypothetical protein